MKVKTIVVGALRVNCYVLYNVKTRECVIIDPGDEPERIISFIKKENLKPLEMWLTHGHFDHIGACRALELEYSIPVFMHEFDLDMYKKAVLQAGSFGLDVEPPPVAPEFFDMSTAGRTLGGTQIRIYHTPGHSPGSVCFYVEQIDSIFTGDLVFNSSIGRTDLLGGSYKKLEQSIRECVYTKQDSCVIYPGHGSSTTVGKEKRGNPFIKG